MNMANEKTIDVHVVTRDSRIPARLYVRFAVEGEGVYLHLESKDLNIEVQKLVSLYEDGTTREFTPRNFLQAMAQGLLPNLPEGARLEMNHIVEVSPPVGVQRFIQVTEEMAAERIEVEATSSFALRFELDGCCYDIADKEDIYYVFLEIAKRVKRTLRICAYCTFARITGYGGDDVRHGLFCFRDNPEAYEDIVSPGYAGLKGSSDIAVWATQSWSNVDAFHSCPAFKVAEFYAEEGVRSPFVI